MQVTFSLAWQLLSLANYEPIHRRIFTNFEKYMLPVSKQKVDFSNTKTNGRKLRNKKEKQLPTNNDVVWACFLYFISMLILMWYWCRVLNSIQIEREDPKQIPIPKSSDQCRVKKTGELLFRKCTVFSFDFSTPSIVKSDCVDVYKLLWAGEQTSRIQQGNFEFTR